MIIILAIFVTLILTSVALAKIGPQVSKKVFIHYPKGPLEHFGRKKPPKGNGGGGVKGGGYKYKGIHWADPDPIDYKINPNIDDVSFTLTSPAVERSFETWELANTNNRVNFVNNGSSSNVGSAFNGENTISWDNISNEYPNAIAITSVWYYTLSKEIVEFDIVFNDDFSWDVIYPVPSDPNNTTGNQNAFDVQNIGTHEAGHTLMLEDIYNPPSRQLTMYGYATLGELKKISLEQGDINGINAIYP